MDSFEPLINLLVTLSVLSVMSEPITNLIKLKNDNLRMKKVTAEEERARVYAITGRGVLVSIALAIALKADIFDMLGQLDAPWDSIGWIQVENYRWMRSPASNTIPGALLAVAGCVFTGLAMGFGSKFWHDPLGSVYELRDLARNRNKKLQEDKP